MSIHIPCRAKAFWSQKAQKMTINLFHMLHAWASLGTLRPPRLCSVIDSIERPSESRSVGSSLIMACSRKGEKQNTNNSGVKMPREQSSIISIVENRNRTVKERAMQEQRQTGEG